MRYSLPRTAIAFALTALLLTLFGCASEQAPLEASAIESVPVQLHDSLVQPDPAAEAIIEPYRSKLEATMNEVINTSDLVMERAKPEGLLGNFVTDLTLQTAQAIYDAEDGQPVDFCLLNHGGLRTTLPAGDITRGKVFELMPFENELVVLTLTGEKTAELFKYLAAVDGQPVAGASVGIQNGLPVDPTVNGSQLDLSRTYKVVTSDYLANGGDNMTFFSEPVNSEAIGKKLRDAIMQHMEAEKAAGRTLTAKLEGRIYHVQ